MFHLHHGPWHGSAELVACHDAVVMQHGILGLPFNSLATLYLRAGHKLTDGNFSHQLPLRRPPLRSESSIFSF